MKMTKTVYEVIEMTIEDASYFKALEKARELEKDKFRIQTCYISRESPEGKIWCIELSKQVLVRPKYREECV